MTGYFLLGAFLLGLLGGATGMGEWKDGQIARKENQRLEAQAKIEAQAKELEQQESKHVAELVDQFDNGIAVGRAQSTTAQVKGQTHVASNPQIYSNPQCIVPAGGVSILNGQIAALRAAAADVLGLSSAGANPNANANGGGVVQPLPAQPVATTGMSQTVTEVRGADQVSGGSLRAHPKPTPVQ